MNRLTNTKSLLRQYNILFMAVTLSAVPTLVHAQNFAQANIGLQYDDNISRGFLSSDTHADTSANIALTAGKFIQLRNNNSLTTFASISAAKFDRLSGLNSQSLEIGSSFTHKFGLGAYVPVFSTSLSWRLEDAYQKTRDHHISTLNMMLSKRLSAAWHFEAGVSKDFSEGLHDGARYQSHYSDRNDIYDFHQQSVFTTLEYGFDNFSTLSFEYSLIDGYTVSSALAPNKALLAVSKALTLDSAIDAPTGRNQVAYTLKSRAHLYGVHWSYPIGRDSSITFSVSRQEIIARKNIDYSNDRIGLSFLHSF